MQNRRLFLLAMLLSTVLLPATVSAVTPVCQANGFNTIACAMQATNLTASDIVAGTQGTGPTRSNQSVKMSISQILNIPGSTQYLPFSGGVLTGKLTTSPATAGSAGFNLAPGVIPTSPVNGDIWNTATGLQTRVAGFNVSLGSTTSGTLTSLIAASPLTGGTITTAGTIGCATCLTTSVGGALSAQAPMVLTGSGLSMGSSTGSAVFTWDANTTVLAGTEYVANPWPWLTGSIQSISYLTAGTTPNFTAGVQINGVNVASCGAIAVTSATRATTTCGANSFVQGNTVTLVIGSVTGTPSSAMVQVAYTKSTP